MYINSCSSSPLTSTCQRSLSLSHPMTLTRIGIATSESLYKLFFDQFSLCSQSLSHFYHSPKNLSPLQDKGCQEIYNQILEFLPPEDQRGLTTTCTTLAATRTDATIWKLKNAFWKNITPHSEVEFDQEMQTLNSRGLYSLKPTMRVALNLSSFPISSTDLRGTIDRYPQAAERIAAIALEQIRFDAEYAAALAELPLTRLELPSCQINSYSLEFVIQLPQFSSLETLNLCKNPIASSGVSLLVEKSQFKALTTLNLSESEINDTDIATLAQLRHNQSLTRLDLSTNLIRAQGASTIATSRNFSTLKILNLSSTAIGDAGVAALAQTPHNQSLTHLNLVHVHNLSDQALRDIATSTNFSALKTLNLFGPRFDISAIESLVRSKLLGSLQELTLRSRRGHGIASVALQHLQPRSPSLKHLNLATKQDYKFCLWSLTYVSSCALLIGGQMKKREIYLCANDFAMMLSIYFSARYLNQSAD